MLYVPILENCADFTYVPRSPEQTAKGGIDMRFSARTPANHDGNYGRLTAVDLRNQQDPVDAATAHPACQRRAGNSRRRSVRGRRRIATSRLTTRVAARLCGARASSRAAESFPVTYSVNGKQYVAVVAGSG